MRVNRFVTQTAACSLLASSLLLSQPSLRQRLAEELSGFASEQSQSFQTESMPAKKSVLLGIAYSLVLPGLGDMYAKKGEVGKYYLGADLGLWLTYAGFQAYGHWVKNDARAYAGQYAGANFSGKSSQFEVDLGNFNSVDDYNQAKLRNREFTLLYDPASSYAWQWISEGERLRFKDERIRGDEILRNSQFIIGALIVNRVIAAVSAARSVSDYNRNIQSSAGWQLRTGISGTPKGADNILLTISKSF